MKKLFLLLIVCLLVNCSKSTQTNSCFTNFLNPISLSLNSAEASNLLVPGGHIIISGGMQGIIIYNLGTDSTNKFRAYDLKCPDCEGAMTLKYPLLKCDCNQTAYSILDGSPQSKANSCSVRTYNVTQNGNTLRITN